jgi:hypothetical protein
VSNGAVTTPVGIETTTKYVPPAETAGTTAVIELGPVTTTLEAETLTAGLATPPRSCTSVTDAPTTNPVPVIVTDEPPEVEPWAGLTADTVGINSEYVNTGPLELVYVVGEVNPVGVVTITKYVPADVTDGETAVMDAEELTVTLGEGNSTMGLDRTPAVSFTNSMTAPLTNPLPAIDIEVPPAVEPCVGLEAP